jgi:hypothetical protein
MFRRRLVLQVQCPFVLLHLCYPCGVNDTSSEAARAQAGVYRAMPGVRKLLMACKMSESVRSLALSRIRSQHPEFDEHAVHDQLTWELYGVRRQR